ncbi:MAG: RNA polymerase sigma factor [Pseudomonadota bacterium]
MLELTEDDRLARDAANGDRDAFGRLVTRHYGRIHALAWRFTGGPPDCEDLTQDVCAALGSKIVGFRGQARFTTWLYRVVLNAARDRMRRDRVRDHATATFAEVDGLRRDEETQRTQDATWLRGEIAILKDNLREAAVLVLDEGLSHAEAAEVLEVKESTVSWRLMEVRKALAARIREEGGVA